MALPSWGSLVGDGVCFAGDEVSCNSCRALAADETRTGDRVGEFWSAAESSAEFTPLPPARAPAPVEIVLLLLSLVRSGVRSRALVLLFAPEEFAPQTPAGGVPHPGKK